MVDRWADKSRDTETEARWTSLRQRPIFTWTASVIAHRSTMSKVVKTRAQLMAAMLQIHEHHNVTAKFLREKGTAGWSLEITGRTNKVSTADPTWGDIFECSFNPNAQSSNVFFH